MMSIHVEVRVVHRHWQKWQHLVSGRIISICIFGMESLRNVHPSVDMTQISCTVVANCVCKKIVMSIHVEVRVVYSHWKYGSI